MRDPAESHYFLFNILNNRNIAVMTNAMMTKAPIKSKKLI